AFTPHNSCSARPRRRRGTMTTISTIERDAATPPAWLRHVQSTTSPPDLSTTEGRRKGRLFWRSYFTIGQQRLLDQHQRQSHIHAIGDRWRDTLATHRPPELGRASKQQHETVKLSSTARSSRRRECAPFGQDDDFGDPLNDAFATCDKNQC